MRLVVKKNTGGTGRRNHTGMAERRRNKVSPPPPLLSTAEIALISQKLTMFAVLSKNGKNGTETAGNSRDGNCGCVPSIQPPPLPSRPPCNTEYVVPTVVPIYGCISPSTTNKNSPLYQKQHKIFAHSQISAHMLVSRTQLDILLSSPQHQNACRKNKGLETTLRV